jgi:hypothetical protein
LSNDPQNPAGLFRRSGSVPRNPVATEFSRWNDGLDLALKKTALQEGYLGMSFGLKSLRTQIREKKSGKLQNKIPKFGKGLISGF